jgi:large subunit ribosomal protein L14
MIFPNSILLIGDNPGAIKVKVIKVISRSKYRWGTISDIVLASVCKARTKKRVKKSEKCRIVIVNIKKICTRINQKIAFYMNTGIVLKKTELVPLASRITLPIPFELKEKGFRRILTMASINL